MNEWKQVKTDYGSVHHYHVSGARVYKLGKKAWKGVEWGVKFAHQKNGCGGFESMKEAKAYVEKFAYSYK